MLRTTLVAVCAMFGATSPALAQQAVPTPREIASAARSAVVTVTAFDGTGEPLRTGTGFLVDSIGTFVTNYHVVEQAHRLSVKRESGEVFDVVFFVSGDSRRDFAILRIPARRTPRLRLSDTEVPEAGDKVYVMSNPLGLEASFSDGIVSSRRVLSGTEVIQITAPISAGSSGGPVLDSRGRVVGIATATFEEGQNLNIAIPIKYVEALLAIEASPQPFAFDLVPTRPTTGERGELRAARYTSVRDPSGTYSVFLGSTGEIGDPYGQLMIVPDGPRYFATGWYRTSSAGYPVRILSPVTLLADGRVAIKIGVDLEGGFVRDNMVILDTPGSTPDITKPLVALLSNAQRGSISSPDGLYSVEGQSRFLSSGNINKWQGVVGILQTELEHRENGGTLVMLYFALDNASGGGKTFSATGSLDAAGVIRVDPVEWDRDRPSTETIEITLRSGEAEVTMLEEYKNRSDRFLNKRIQLAGSKVRQ